MFRTRITQLFGIEYPIVQGGMLWISRVGFVSAVSNAGGLGLITALTFPNADDLAAEIRRTRALTDKPFGVNVTLIPTLRDVSYDYYFDVVEQEGIKIVETAGSSPAQYLERLKTAGIKVMHKCTSLRHARSAEKLGCDAVFR